MMRERPENDNAHEADWLGKDSLDEREPLLAALTADGSRWRAEHAATVTKIEQRLESVAPRSSAGAHSRRGGWWRTPWVGVVGAAVVLVGFAATLLAAYARQPLQIGSHLAPQTLTWADKGRYAATAQEAFATGLTLTPCTRDPGATRERGAPPRSMSVTWLFTSDNYGMVRMFWTCQSQWDRYGLYVLTLDRSAGSGWTIARGADLWYPSSTATIAPTLPPVPSWLALPSDIYDSLDFRASHASQGPRPEVSAIVWYSSTYTYVLGHASDTATRPSDATTVHIDGHSGWATDVNDYVTVTVPLADGTTAFFSGNGSLEYVESLATSAIAHMNAELLPLGAA